MRDENLSSSSLIHNVESALKTYGEKKANLRENVLKSTKTVVVKNIVSDWNQQAKSKTQAAASVSNECRRIAVFGLCPFTPLRNSRLIVFLVLNLLILQTFFCDRLFSHTGYRLGRLNQEGRLLRNAEEEEDSVIVRSVPLTRKQVLLLLFLHHLLSLLFCVSHCCAFLPAHFERRQKHTKELKHNKTKSG